MPSKKIPDEVWETARALWENTPDISYDDLIEHLKDSFGDKAPTSKSTIYNRIKKEKWIKGSLVSKPAKMSESRTDKIMSNIEQKSPDKKSTDTQNNKDKKAEKIDVYRTINDEVDEAKNKVVMSTEQKAKIIVKHRKRLHNAGVLQDAIIEMSIDLANSVLNPEPEPFDDEEADFVFDEEESPISKKLNVIKSLSNVLANVTIAQKTIAEQEMPMCGITPDDFQQSEQERRIGALEALAGIHEEEEKAREIKRRELQERMQTIAQLEHDPDFFNSDDDIEDVEIDEDY